MKNDQQKTGILFSLPVCIVVTFFVFPIGIILISMRLYKRGKVSKTVKNIGVGVGAAFIGMLVLGLFTLPEVDTPGVAAKPNPSASEVITPTPSSQDIPSQPSESLPIESPAKPEPVQTSEPEPIQAPEPPPEILEPEPTSDLSIYETLLKTVRDDIDLCLESSPPDLEALRENYEFLLAVCVNEYVFKTFGYGYFTDNYSTNQYDYLLEITNSLCAEMKEYFDEEEVDEYLTYCTRMAGRSYNRFDFKECLIGEESSPDLNAMWEAHTITSLGIDTETGN